MSYFLRDLATTRTYIHASANIVCLQHTSSRFLNMDKIQFENRAEIGAIIKALEEWQEDHGKDETVQELISKLDVMSMNW